MVSQIQGYWMQVIAPTFFVVRFTPDPFPPGTNVWASISLSQVDTLFVGNAPDPTFAVEAFVDSWTTYNPDGSESGLQTGQGFAQNAVGVANCARINFVLAGERATAFAQINVFIF